MGCARGHGGTNSKCACLVAGGTNDAPAIWRGADDDGLTGEFWAVTLFHGGIEGIHIEVENCPWHRSLVLRISAERMLPRDPFCDRLIADKVLVDDASTALRCDFPIPYPIWVNGHPRALAANAKAGRLGSHDRDAQVADAVFEGFPDLHPCGFGAAVWTDAEKNVPLAGGEAHFRKSGIPLLH